jgi:hypothetical protein
MRHSPCHFAKANGKCIRPMENEPKHKKGGYLKTYNGRKLQNLQLKNNKLHSTEQQSISVE